MKHLKEILAIVLMAIFVFACSPPELTDESNEVETEVEITATGGDDDTTTDDDRDGNN